MSRRKFVSLAVKLLLPMFKRFGPEIAVASVPEEAKP